MLPQIELLRRVMGDPEGPGEAPSGGALRVAVVTPYHRESEALLATCHRSVLAQSHPCVHILVADGARAAFTAGWRAQHIELGRGHADFGDTPRAVGALSAAAQGFDAVAFLDADNWLAPDHVATMVALHEQTAASVCVASRSLHRLDGTLLRDSGDAGEGVDFVDTSCLFVTAGAYRVLPIWSLLPRRFHPIGDRLVWWAIRALNYRVARCTRPTVRYRTAFRVHYEEQGELAPPGAKEHAGVVEALRAWREMPAEERDLVARRLGVPL